MSKYAAAINRLLHPKKYPLYRTVPLRYVFLHLLIFAFLLSWPGILRMYESTHTLKVLLEEKEHLIPHFTIENGKLKLPNHPQTTIRLSSGTITFTEAKKPLPSDQLSFTRDKLYIKNFESVSYQNLGDIHNKEQMIQTLKVYTQSAAFFLMLIGLAMISIQYAILLIKILFISYIAHFISILLHKKSNVMNWLKITAFLLTLPVFLQYIGLLVSNALFNVLSWCIIMLLVGLAIHYLPDRKKSKV